MGAGRFWAVGVGPGDPELLTVKAVRLLQSVHAIYHAGPTVRQGRAWEIVRAHLRPGQSVGAVLPGRMAAIAPADWRSHYRPGVEQIAADCRRGLDVAYVTEGDPTVFSTASYVWQLLAELAPEVPIEVVPGVTSITAAAARVQWPLGQREEPFAVVPASYHRHQLPQFLADFPTVCLLKAGAALPALMSAVGPEQKAVYIENLGTSQEWVTYDLSQAVDRAAYFSLVLVRRSSPGAAAPSGRLSVVGLGPGDPRVLTAQACAALREAEVILGYDGYLQRLAPLGLRGELRPSPIGAEQERATLALELAAAGKRVALVSSGDAGVFGMASLVLETAQALPDVQVEIVPGVSAALAGAALLGAPLGHDFACVSLSDLLTPWPVIERRLEAAGQGDFVLALFNPVSRRRTWQLPRARDVLLSYRDTDTPVGLVDKAYREGTRVWLTTLGELTVKGIGMETLVVIGSSRTRVINDRLVTPRGYGERT